MNNSQEKSKNVKAPEFIVFEIALEMVVLRKALEAAELPLNPSREQVEENISILLAANNRLAEWHDKLDKVQTLIEGYDPPEYIKKAVQAAEVAE